MNRKIYFCAAWSNVRGRPSELWSIDQALAAEASGQPYTVLVDSDTRPACVIEIVPENDFIAVDFLDERLRATLTYFFTGVDEHRLFLAEAKSRHFDGDEATPAGGTDYFFRESGGIDVTEFEGEAVRSGQTGADVSRNYSPRPSFGEYDEILRRDR